MKIIRTQIPDITKENIDQSKLKLANNIIQNIFPLFDEVHESKIEELKKSMEELKTKKSQVTESKDLLQQHINEYNKKKKAKKLVQRISKLIVSGLVLDGTLKNETVVLLKIIDKLTDEKLDYHLSETLRTINKRFSRIA